MAHGSNDEDVNVKFGAKIDELQEALTKIPEMLTGVTEAFAAMAAIIAGGKLFEEFVNEANEAAVAAQEVNRVIGISTDEANTLAVALDDVSSQLGGAKVTTQDYEQAFMKFAQQLRNNSDELRAYGVDVDAVRNGTKTSNEVFHEALAIVQQYKPGLDQAQVAMTLFGRSVGNVQALMQVTPELLDESRKHAEEFGLSLSQEGVKAAADFRGAMNNVHDTLDGMARTIGTAVMPVLTELANWFVSIGPSAIAAIRAAIETLSTAFLGVVWAVDMVIDVLKAVLYPVMNFGKAVRSLVDGDINQATKQAQDAFNGWGDAFRHVGDEMTADSKRIWGEIKAVWSHSPLADDKKEDGKNAPDLKHLQSLLEARNALQKAMNDAALALNLEYFKDEQAALDDELKNNLLSLKDYYDSKLTIETAAIDASIAAKRKEKAEAASAAGNNALPEEERLKFMAQEVKLAGEINVLEAQRNAAVAKNARDYADAAKKRADELANIEITAKQGAADAEVDIEHGAILQMQALRQIDAQTALAQEAELENKKYAATMAAIEARRKLAEGDEVKQAQLNADAEKAYQEHQARLTDLARQAEAERLKYSLQDDQQIENAFGKMTGDLLGAHKRLRDAVLEFGQQIAHTFQNLIAQRFAEKLFGGDSAGGKVIDAITKPVFAALDMVLAKFTATEAAKTAATEEGTAMRLAIETWAAFKSVALTAWTAIKTIGAKAAEAFASVYASIAQIPYVGPFLAPVMAGAALYEVGSMAGHLASAEGGWWQVPGDQIAQIHKNEMVLPAEHAANLRALLGGGAEGLKGSGGDTHVHVTNNVRAMDSHSFTEYLKNNPEALAAGVKNAVRLGHGRGMA